jgi:3'-5' exonuclease
MILSNLDWTKILFLDIECVSEKSHFDELDERLQYLWHRKAKSLGALPKDLAEDSPEYQTALADSYREKAAIYAEFGKIICISVGVIAREKDAPMTIRLKSFANDDERVLLADFANLVNKSFNDPMRHSLCGHNIKEFDIPYICRRMVKLKMTLPNILNLQGKKPWETNFLIDTMLLWKFGDFKSFTSLSLLCAIFDIPTPKDDIDGSQVGTVYWDDNDLPRISTYCQKDVLAVAQVLLYLQQAPLIEDSNVIIV